MILQALKEYYDRKAADPDSNLPPFGWERKEIPFLAVIDQNGRFLRFEDTREGEGKKKRAREFLVPSLGEKKGNGIKSNLFWENVEYMFGIPVPKKGKNEVNVERVAQQHETFCARIERIRGDSAAIHAAKAFCRDKENAERAKADPLWEEVLATNQSILLSLVGHGPVTNDAAVRTAVGSADEAENPVVCQVTGERAELSLLEMPIKGVRGAQATGASLVSMNLTAFNSYGKQQGENASISKPASFAYATALNHLLRKDSSQRLSVGDATVVFWAQRHHELEDQMQDLFEEPPKDDPDRGTRAVRALLRAVDTGVFSEDDRENRFYVLGLAPNAARLAVRFWQVGTIASMSERIAQHFRDLEIVHGPRDKDVLSLFRLLTSIAVQGKADNIPPNLAGETMRTILAGLPYPASLLQAAIRRNRAEQAVNYPRASLIKACINRALRFDPNGKEKELTMALDRENRNIGYRLGRLFATLEKIQQEASPDINATIRDRFYGAASSTPATVFGNLMRLKNHHLAKLENPGRRINLERLLGEIHDGIDDYPAHLRIGDQGRFAIGYYHQMQDFYTKKEDREVASDQPASGQDK